MTNLAIPQSTASNSLTKFDLGLLAIRLFGLYLLVQALLHLASIPLMLHLGPTTSSGSLLIAVTVVAAPALVYAVCAFAALRSSDRIVRRLFPDFTPGATLSVTGRDLQAVLFSVVGLWLVATAFPSSLRTLMLWWFIRAVPRASDHFQFLPETVRDLAQILIGVFLFARAKGLSLFWHRLRTAGTNTTP